MLSDGCNGYGVMEDEDGMGSLARQDDGLSLFPTPIKGSSTHISVE